MSRTRAGVSQMTTPAIDRTQWRLLRKGEVFRQGDIGVNATGMWETTLWKCDNRRTGKPYVVGWGAKMTAADGMHTKYYRFTGRKFWTNQP